MIDLIPVKKLIKAPEGYEVWEFDYSQMEFRLAVVYCESKLFTEGFEQGNDVHAMTAQKIGAYNQFPDNPDQARYVGKQANFLIINRGGPAVLQKQIWTNARIDLELKVCKGFLSEWHATYPEFERTAQAVENSAKAKGYVKLWNGRRRHFDSSRPWEARAAFNSLIQGGAGQIMFESMIMLDDLNYEMISQIHDAVWILIPKDKVEKEVPKIQSIMSWPSESFGLPFVVDAKCLAA